MITPCKANASPYAGCDTTIWFVNIYPGSEIYELEGHSALRIKICDADYAVNYGMFSFETPNFVYRFVKGETDYMVGLIPWDVFIAEYRNDGRRIVAHRLNLDGAQKHRLLDLVNANLLPRNRVYRYNYVLDNCATRPLRTVELAAGDTIMVGDVKINPSLDTFREYMTYYHANYPWYQFGIDLALGKGIDRQITLREKTFAPVLLDEQIVNATIGTDGNRKLVSETEILNDTAEDAVVSGATPWFLTPNCVFWCLCIILSVYVATHYVRTGKYPRFAATVVFAVFGVAGLLVAFLVFISVHESTSPNLNLLWLNPLCLVPTVSLWIKRAKIVNCWYFLFNFALILSVIVLWTVGYQQYNPAFIPLIIVDTLLSGLYLYSYFCKR